MRAVRSTAPQDRRARSDAPYQLDKMRIAADLRTFTCKASILALTPAAPYHKQVMRWSEFRKKWPRYQGKQRSGCQQYSEDFCWVLGERPATKSDLSGSDFCCYHKRVISLRRKGSAVGERARPGRSVWRPRQTPFGGEQDGPPFRDCARGSRPAGEGASRQRPGRARSPETTAAFRLRPMNP